MRALLAARAGRSADQGREARMTQFLHRREAVALLVWNFIFRFAHGGWLVMGVAGCQPPVLGSISAARVEY